MIHINGNGLTSTSSLWWVYLQIIGLIPLNSSICLGLQRFHTWRCQRPCYLMHKFQGQRLQWTSSKPWRIQWSSHPQTSHQRGGLHHILVISRVSRTPTPPIKWEQRLFQEYHHHIQGLHIIKNISNGSTIYLHHHESTNTPKRGLQRPHH